MNEIIVKEEKRMSSLAPRNFSELRDLSAIVAGSGMAPKQYAQKPDDCLVAMLAGNEIGLGPMASLQKIAVINGRPSIYGDAAMALVRASKQMVGGAKETIESEKGNLIAKCTVQRVGEDPVTREFSWTDAERAGLTRKDGPWKSYPKRMLMMRARAWALRDVFPDILNGIGVFEEAQDIPADPIPVQSISEVDVEEKDAPDEWTVLMDRLIADLDGAVNEEIISEQMKEDVLAYVDKKFKTPAGLKGYVENNREKIEEARAKMSDEKKENEDA